MSVEYDPHAVVARQLFVKRLARYGCVGTGICSIAFYFIGHDIWPETDVGTVIVLDGVTAFVFMFLGLSLVMCIYDRRFPMTRPLLLGREEMHGYGTTESPEENMS